MKAKILYRIPHTLLYSRLLVAGFIIVLSFVKISSEWVVGLAVYAMISDVLDGIIARYLKISTVKMRQLDTKIDTVFWFSCLFYICMNHPGFLRSHFTQIFILVLSELLIIVFGYLKFRERISYHTILSKFWALILLWFLTELILTGECQFSFQVAFWYGILVQTEILFIGLILPEAQTDVPGIKKAFRLKKGEKITKNRFFNG